MFLNNVSLNKNNPGQGFGSLKPQKRLAEKVLREFRNEMGSLQSSSKLQYRLLRIERGKPRVPDLIRSLKRKQYSLHKQIMDSKFENYRKRQIHVSLDAFINKLKGLIHEKKGKADCWEHAVIMHQKLREKGFNPQMFQIRVFTKTGYMNHFSNVIGLKKGADITKPKAWGSKALVPDAWKGFVMNAHNAKELFKRDLSCGQKIIGTYFFDANPVNLIKIKPNKVS